MNHALSIIIIIMIITIIIITIIIIIVAAIPIVDKRGIVTVSLIYSILSSCRLKFTAQRDLTSERTQHMLEMMAEPHRWQLARLEHGQKDRCIISSTCLLTITFYTQISRTFPFSLLYYFPLLTFFFFLSFSHFPSLQWNSSAGTDTSHRTCQRASRSLQSAFHSFD